MLIKAWELFAPVQLAKFETIRDSYFDITADDAIEVVMCDPKKTKEAREEDADFIRRLRQNQFVASTDLPRGKMTKSNARKRKKNGNEYDHIFSKIS